MKKLMLLVLVLGLASMAAAMSLPEGPDGYHAIQNGSTDDVYNYTVTGTELSTDGEWYIDGETKPTYTLKSHVPISNFVTARTSLTIPAGKSLNYATKMRVMGDLNVYGEFNFNTWSNALTVGNWGAGVINAYSGTILVDPLVKGNNDGIRFPNNSGGYAVTMNIWDCAVSTNAINFGDGSDADKINFMQGGEGYLAVRTRTFTDSTNPYYKGTSWNPSNYPNRLVPGKYEAIIVTQEGDWTIWTSEVPEPATMLLLGLGGLLLRRKRS